VRLGDAHILKVGTYLRDVPKTQWRSGITSAPCGEEALTTETLKLGKEVA